MLILADPSLLVSQELEAVKAKGKELEEVPQIPGRGREG